MPEVSRFFGIVVAMYFKEHAPPHFHVKYGERRAVFSIQDLRLIDGKLSPRIISFVLEWAFLHRDELLDNWVLARKQQALKKIAPLV